MALKFGGGAPILIFGAGFCSFSFCSFLTTTKN
jgi:hypothetical protein